MVQASVMDNADLVWHILQGVDLDPWTFVMCGRVSSVWRAVCHVDDALLMKAARGHRFLTKGVFCGLFGLSASEADAYTRGMRAYKHGRMYMYSEPAIGAVMGDIGGLNGWAARLTARAMRQDVVEVGGNGKQWVALDRKRARNWHDNAPNKRRSRLLCW
jgi:hypothetical protein